MRFLRTCQYSARSRKEPYETPLSLSLCSVLALGCGAEDPTDAPENVAEATAAVLTPDVTSLNFGSVHVNGSSTLQVWLTNNGSQTTDVTATNTSNPFSAVMIMPCARPGESHPVDVTFHPTSTGNFSNTLTIEAVTGGVRDPDITVSLKGTGVP